MTNQRLDILDQMIKRADATRFSSAKEVPVTHSVTAPLVIYPIVLMAGLSTRMGPKDKLLLPFGNSTISQTVLTQLAMNTARYQTTAAARRSHEDTHDAQNKTTLLIQPLSAVVSSPETAEIVCATGHNIILNDHPELGQGHSVALAARSVLAEAQRHNLLLSRVGVMISLGDQPHVPYDLVHDLLYIANQLSSFSPFILTPRLLLTQDSPATLEASRPVHPMIFVGVLPQLATLRGEAGGKQLWSCVNHYQLISTSSCLCTDIDTPEDYRQACRDVYSQREDTVTPLTLVCKEGQS